MGIRESQDSSLGEYQTHTQTYTRSSQRLGWLAIVVLPFTLLGHIALLWWSTSTWLPMLQHSAIVPVSNQRSLFSPFHDVVRYETVAWPEDAWENSAFTGPVSPELDAAWDKLMAVEGIRISPEEASQLNFSSNIRLHGGDHGTIVGYFHNLHCLRNLNEAIHSQSLLIDETDQHAGMQHLDHCIEVLRRSVLCNPDLTLHEISWEDEYKEGMKLRSASPRQCVDFQSINDFADGRKYRRSAIVDA